MFCHECGKENPDCALFCTNCGTPLEKKNENDTVTLSPNAEGATESDAAEVIVLPAKSTQKTITIACIVVILMVLLAVGGLFAWKYLTKKELSLDENTIKDAALRSTLTVKYDLDQDGKLSEEELNNVNEIEVTDGSDLSWISYFPNLREGVIDDEEVEKLDLSKNTNLVAIDLSKCTYLKELILPNIESYDEYKLPNNEDLVVKFDGNSDFEAKWVPKKVSQTTYYVSKDSVSSAETVLDQDVVSAYQIRSISAKTNGSGWDTTISYDESGRIVEMFFGNDVRTLDYSTDNKVSRETMKTEVGQSRGPVNYPVFYNADGTVSEAFNLTFSEEGNGKLEYRGVAEWDYDEDKVSSYYCSLWGGQGHLRREFDFDSESHCSSEAITTYVLEDVTKGDDGIAAIGPHTVSYTYENGKLVKTEFDNGFVQNYSYDSNGNLKTITSSDEPNVVGIYIAKDCDVEYARVICKKDQKPLSFIELAGAKNSGIINLSCEARYLTTCNYVTHQYRFTTADFSGYFWWDDENVIKNQVAAKEAKKKLLERVAAALGTDEGNSDDDEADSSGSSTSTAREQQIQSYRDQGYLVYEGVSKFHAANVDYSDGFSLGNFYYVQLNEAQEVPTSKRQYTAGTEYPVLNQICDAGDETTLGKDVLVVVKKYISMDPTVRCNKNCGGVDYEYTLGPNNFVVIAET